MLAARLGLSYQQVHKYETGVNRIMVGRLHALAEVLGVDVAYFYEGLGTADRRVSASRGRAMLELARSFLAIADRRGREALLVLADVAVRSGVAG